MHHLIPKVRSLSSAVAGICRALVRHALSTASSQGRELKDKTAHGHVISEKVKTRETVAFKLKNDNCILQEISSTKCLVAIF